MTFTLNLLLQPQDAARVSCEAVPAASRHGWRDDTACASTASIDVLYRDETHHICRIHEGVLMRVAQKDGQRGVDELVQLWGWQV